jgi:galacturonokinase
MLHLFLNRVDDLQKPIDNPENINWESYARGAVYALQNNGYDLNKVTQLHLSI